MPLQFQAVMARTFGSYDYEAAVLRLVRGDADPNPEINVWTSGEATHLWALSEKQPATDWQAEINPLMRAQTGMLNYQERKHAYDRVRELLAQFDPVICVVSPHVLVGVKKTIGGFRPAAMGDYVQWKRTSSFGAITRPRADKSSFDVEHLACCHKRADSSGQLRP